MPVPLDSLVVSVATIGYASALWTRDWFFGSVAFTFGWLLLVAPTYYADETTYSRLDTFFFVPLAAFLAALAGHALAKLLAIGQMIVVWPSRSGGDLVATDGSTHRSREDWNVPFTVLGLVCTFFTAFFAVAAAVGSPQFLSGVFPVLDQAVLIVLSIVAAILAMLLFIVGATVKTFSSYSPIATNDYTSLYYLFALFVALTASLLTWHLLSTSSIVATGAWTAAVTVVTDWIVLAGGYLVESACYDTENAGRAVWRIRFSSRQAFESNGALVVARFLLVPLVHGGFFVVGAFGVDAAAALIVGERARLVFWPYVALYSLIVFGVAAFIYLLIRVAFEFSVMRRSIPTGSAGSVGSEAADETVTLVESEARPVMEDGVRRRVPASSTTATDHDSFDVD